MLGLFDDGCQVAGICSWPPGDRLERQAVSRDSLLLEMIMAAGDFQKRRETSERCIRLRVMSTRGKPGDGDSPRGPDRSWDD